MGPQNSHLPARKRERTLQRFKFAEHAQRFLGAFSAVCNQFRPRRHRLTASAYRQVRAEQHAVWLDVALAGVRPHWLTTGDTSRPPVLVERSRRSI